MAVNLYANAVTGATPNPLIADPGPHDEAFARAADAAIENAVELARDLVGAHQAAAAIIAEEDWATARKYFSLSNKYSAWARYRTPARGYGSHAWLMAQAKPVRLTQAELEAHPAWQGFGGEAGRHPPMRGWLAAPITDGKGKGWGLFQLSDKVDGEFDEADEGRFLRLAALLSQALEALWALRNARVAGAAAP